MRQTLLLSKNAHIAPIPETDRLGELMYLYPDLLEQYNSRDDLASTGIWAWVLAGHHRTNHAPVVPLNGNTLLTKWTTKHAQGCGKLKNWKLITVRAGNSSREFNFHEFKISDEEELELPKQRNQSFKVQGQSCRSRAWKKQESLPCLEDRILPWGFTTVPHALPEYISTISQGFPDSWGQKYVVMCSSLWQWQCDCSVACLWSCCGKPRTYKGDKK